MFVYIQFQFPGSNVGSNIQNACRPLRLSFGDLLQRHAFQSALRTPVRAEFGELGLLLALSRTARTLQLEAVRNLVELEPAFPEQPPVVTVQVIPSLCVLQSLLLRPMSALSLLASNS